MWSCCWSFVFSLFCPGWATLGLGGLAEDLHRIPRRHSGWAREVPQPEEAPAAARNEEVLRLHRRRWGVRVEEDELVRQKFDVGVGERRDDANAELQVRRRRLRRHLRRLPTSARAARVSRGQEILTKSFQEPQKSIETFPIIDVYLIFSHKTIFHRALVSQLLLIIVQYVCKTSLWLKIHATNGLLWI